MPPHVFNGESHSWTYDAIGNRLTSAVNGVPTTYLYDGLNLVGEISGGVTANYIFGPGIDEPLASYRAGQLSYFASDGLGTIGETNDTAGNATLSTTFDAWGVTRAETGSRTQPFTYTGREVGEAGLLFYGARYLQAGVGRFTQEDPARPRAGGMWYLFAYGQNAPTQNVDPLGLLSCSPTPPPPDPPEPTPTPRPKPRRRYKPGTPCVEQTETFEECETCCRILNPLKDVSFDRCDADCMEHNFPGGR